MKELFDFLNSQSDEILFGYGIVFCISMYYITQCLVFIFESIFNKKNNENRIKTIRFFF